MIKINKIKKRKGLTLVETILVLGVATLIIASAMSLYSQANIKNKVSNTRMEYYEIRNVVKALYANNNNSSDWSQLSSNLIINTGMLSKKYIKNNSIINPFGGRLVIYYVNNQTPNSSSGYSYYQTVFYGIPKPACVMLTSTHDYQNNGPTMQINSLQDNYKYQNNINSIIKNGCNHTSNMVAYATSISQL